MVPSPLDEAFSSYLENRRASDLARVFDGSADSLLAIAERAGLDKSSAEDLLQETFLAVFAQLDSFERGRPFLPWASGIMAHQVRAEKRRRARLFEFINRDSNATDPTPAVAPMEAEEANSAIRAAVAKLPQGQRSLVEQTLFDGLPPSQLAARHGLSSNVVSVRVHRGLRRVRELLASGASIGVLSQLLSDVAQGGAPSRGLPAVRRAVLESRTAVALNGSAPAVSGGGLFSAWTFGGVAALMLAAFAALLWTKNPSSAAARIERENEVAAAAPDDAKGPVDRGAQGRALADSAEEGEPRLAVEATVAGLVVDPAGRPAERGVQLFLLGGYPTIDLPTAPIEPFTATLDGGVFTIPEWLLSSVNEPLIMARAQGLVGYVDVQPGTPLPLRIPLRASIDLEVHVVDDTGRPVEGARVAAFSSLGRFFSNPGPVAMERGIVPVKPYEHLFGATTDAGGVGRIEGLLGYGAERSIVVASAWKAGYATVSAIVRPGRDGRIDRTEIVMPSTSTLACGGLARSATGGPLSGFEARFVYRGDLPDAVAQASRIDVDGAGAWTIPHEWLNEFPFKVELRADGHLPATLQFFEPSQLIDPDDEHIVVLTAARRARVQVVDAQGNPMAGARGETLSGTLCDSWTTDDEGRAELVLGQRDRAIIRVDGLTEEAGPGAYWSCTLDCCDDVVAAGEIRLTAPSIGAGLRSLKVAAAALETGEQVPIERATFVPMPAACGDSRELQVAGEWNLEITGGSGEAQIPNGTAGIVFVVTGDGRSGYAELDLAQGAAGRLEQDAVIVDVVRPTDLSVHLDMGGESLEAMARVRLNMRLRIPVEPPFWFRRQQSGAVTDLLREVGSESGFELEFRNFVAGVWDVSFTSTEFSSTPQAVTLREGEPATVDVLVREAGLLLLDLPPVSRPGYAVLEVREPGDAAADYRFHTAGVIQSDGLDHFVAALPAGRFEWRLRSYYPEGGGALVRLLPEETGTVDVRAGGHFIHAVE